MDVFIVDHGITEATGNPLQDDMDQVVVRHLGMNSKSMHIGPVFLQSLLVCVP